MRSYVAEVEEGCFCVKEFKEILLCSNKQFFGEVSILNGQGPPKEFIISKDRNTKRFLIIEKWRNSWHPRGTERQCKHNNLEIWKETSKVLPIPDAVYVCSITRETVFKCGGLVGNQLSTQVSSPSLFKMNTFYLFEVSWGRTALSFIIIHY